MKGEKCRILGKLSEVDIARIKEEQARRHKRLGEARERAQRIPITQRRGEVAVRVVRAVESSTSEGQTFSCRQNDRESVNAFLNTLKQGLHNKELFVKFQDDDKFTRVTSCSLDDDWLEFRISESLRIRIHINYLEIDYYIRNKAA